METTYILQNNYGGRPSLIGQSEGTIQYEENQWIIKSGEASAHLLDYKSVNKYPFGRQEWWVHDPSCSYKEPR